MGIRVALVTGGGSGIGRAVALALAAEGYAVAICGRRIERLQETVRQGEERGGRLLAVQADVSQPEPVNDLFAQVEAEFGRLDVLFNNAGGGAPAVPIDELTFEQWQTVVGANLTGTFLCTQAAFKLMKKQDPRGGRIINNGSISAHAPRPNSAPYTSTKHGVLGLTKSTSLDGRAFDIACGQIDIGNAGTEMAARLGQGALQPDGSVRPEPLLDVDHVARAVVYMAHLPLDANVQFLTVMATKMPFVGRG
jgi:NAD(P)-dependent dehydrogenase (short-subunit alcohol dehydrogenase family)